MALRPVLFAVLLVLAYGQLGPKYKPGDVIAKTDFSDVDTALNDVMKAGGVLNGRRLAIGIANLAVDSDLTSPKWYMYSGNIYSSAPPAIKPRYTGMTLFHKKAVFIWGTTGLLTYDIEGTDYKIAMSWQVPWNIILYDVLFNVKIYHKDVPTDKAMFDQMVDYAGTQKSVGWIERTEYGIEYKGTITNSDYSKLYVSVDASEYNATLPASYHAACERNALWFGKYCMQECHPTGYCWVNKKCSSAADCGGPLLCHDKCKK